MPLEVQRFLVPTRLPHPVNRLDGPHTAFVGKIHTFGALRTLAAMCTLWHEREGAPMKIPPVISAYGFLIFALLFVLFIYCTR